MTGIHDRRPRRDDAGDPGRVPGRNDERRVLAVLILTATVMAAEVAGGVISGSLALLADAGHMTSDTLALALALAAFRLARRPSDTRRSYGYHRVEILAAFANGLFLLGLAVWIVAEALTRLAAPPPVEGLTMLSVAALGLAVNAIALWLLHAGDRDNLNLEGAFLHVLGDLLGSVAAVAAGIVILTTGWMTIDPLLSMLVAVLIARSALALLRRASHVLLEGTPDHIDAERVKDAVRKAVPEVAEVHHVHVWSLSGGRPLLTMHATVPEADGDDRVLARIQAVLAKDFGITHATVQIERRGCGA